MGGSAESPAAPTGAGGAAMGLPVLPYALTVFEFSLATASLAELEEVARTVGPSWAAATFRDRPWIEELGLLATCHRVELLVGTRDPARLAEWAADRPGRATGWRRRSGAEAVLHLFRVAAGLESLAVGEREVADQVRAAAHAVLGRRPRPVLKSLLLDAARAAEEASPPPVARSIARAAADRLLREADAARPAAASAPPHLVVVGSGRIGRQLAGHLAGRARVTVVYRSLPPPDGALPADGVRTAPFDRLPELLREADGVVTAAKSAGRLLGPGPLADRLRPLPLVDLGVPRNVDPAVGTLPGIRLIDLEELFRTAPPVRDAGPGTERLLAEARAAAARLERVRPEAWVDALLRAAEAVRADEVARARPYLDGLSAAQQLAVDHLTRRIVARLLKRPIEDLRSLPPGTDGDAERDRRWRRSVPAGDRP